MNWNDYTALGLAFIAAVFSIWSFFYERKRNVREATIHAFDELEREATDAIMGLLLFKNSLEQIRGRTALQIANDYSNLKGSERWTEITRELALFEHFAVGVNYGTYDITVLNAMAGNKLINMWEQIKPIIDAKRSDLDGKDNYAELEKMVMSLKKKRK